MDSNKNYELDPYEILQVDYDASLDNIRQSFKQLVLRHHPDRGGNPKNFNIIKGAYTYIYKQKKEEEKLKEKKDRTIEEYVEIRENDAKDSGYTRQPNSIRNNEIIDDGTVINPNNFDVQSFNNLFGRYRVENANDYGYGDEMQESSKNRTKLEKLTKDKSNSNNDFKKQELVIYEEPTPISSLKDNYAELGEEHITNFSNKHTNKMRYTDYKQAYSEKEQLTENTENVRNQNYKNIDDLQRDRSNISYELTDIKKMKLKEKEKQETKLEMRRRWKLQQTDEKVSDRFNQMQNLIRFG